MMAVKFATHERLNRPTGGRKWIAVVVESDFGVACDEPGGDVEDVHEGPFPGIVSHRG